MKKLALVLSVAFLATILSSCEQCTSCSYAYRINGADSSKVFPQECGKKKDLDNYETAIRRESVKLGGTVTCVEE